MSIKINSDFFFRRKRITMVEFLIGVSSFEEAIEKFESHCLVDYDELEIRTTLGRLKLLEDARKHTANKPSKPSVNKSRAKKAKAKKAVDDETGQVIENAEENNGESEEEEYDSGYFETWKVPYVEP